MGAFEKIIILMNHIGIPQARELFLRVPGQLQTNNNPEVIKALREQQALYLEKDGKNNGKLERVLDGL